MALGEPTPGTPPAWYAQALQQVADEFGVQPEEGLSRSQAQRQLERCGPNRLRPERHESFLEVLLEELREPMVLLLLFTGVLYSIWGSAEDAITIFFVIITLALIEVFNEQRAKRTIAALRKLAEPTTPVRRDGQVVEVPAEQVVPGDVIVLQAGRRVPADARLVQAFGLSADESALTGESVPVEKDARAVLPEGMPLAERRNMVFAGSALTRGRGSAVVVATGPATELGRVAGLARQVKPPRTPLQVAMRQLTQSLVWIALGFSVLVPVLGLLNGQPPQQMLLTGLSLAFATIPEEMPIIITMVLALGGYRLSKQHAVVKRLQAVETLGAVTVIATDKTGTLTENRMRVGELYPPGQSRELLELGVLCDDTPESAPDAPETGFLAETRFLGDPLDRALADAARQVGVDAVALRRANPIDQEFTFDAERKLMSVVRGGRALVRGAPEAVLARCAGADPSALQTAAQAAAAQTAEDMARRGLRVIALARKDNVPPDSGQAEVESGLTFVGLLGFEDPPRPEAAGAIRTCREAGVRTIMVTGDHPLTARAVARQVGLDGASAEATGEPRLLTGAELDAMTDEQVRQAVGEVAVFARTTPEHKLRIVRALHALSERVAVTGDGVNDAPALAAADIGVAMGETGTDVAREAGDMVLTDDNFATITRAVQEGRVLFANLRKGVRYYLACKVALMSATLLPVLLAVPVPFAPVQIILMELFMDLAASATFVAEKGEAGLMRRPPRDPRAHFMDRAMVGSIFASAAGLFVAVSAAYLVTWFGTHDLPRAQTVAFVTWLLGHVLLAMAMRSERQGLLQLGLSSNRLMVAWAAATVTFVLLVTLIPPVRGAVRTSSLGAGDWALAAGAAFAGAIWLEVRKYVPVHDRG